MTTASVICGESTLNFDTAQAAADYIRDHSLEGATLRLYADHCYPLEIDTPLILDSNGYKLYNGVSTGKNAYLKSVDGELSFYESPSIFYANISIYQAPYEKRVTPVATLMLSIGESYVLPEAELYVDPETNERYEPLDEWLLYDASGKVISGGISQIAEEHIGEHYVLCPTYTSPSV